MFPETCRHHYSREAEAFLGTCKEINLKTWTRATQSREGSFCSVIGYLSCPMVTRSLLKYWDMSSLMKNMSSWSMSWAWIHIILPTLVVQLQLSWEKSHMYWLPRLASSSDPGQILYFNGVFDKYDPTHRKCDYFHRLHQYSLDESRTYQETLNNKSFLDTFKIHSFRMREWLH